MSQEEFAVDRSFTFRKRPWALPGDVRLSWRLPLFLLIIYLAGHGGKLSLLKLRVLSWAIKTEKTRNQFNDAIRGALAPNQIVVRFEPILERTLDFLVGERLAEIIDGRAVRLTETGKAHAKKINETADVFQKEKEFLKEIKGKVRENDIEALLNWAAPN